MRPGAFDQRGWPDFFGCANTLPLNSRGDVLTFQTPTLPPSSSMSTRPAPTTPTGWPSTLPTPLSEPGTATAGTDRSPWLRARPTSSSSGFTLHPTCSNMATGSGWTSAAATGPALTLTPTPEGLWAGIEDTRQPTRPSITTLTVHLTSFYPFRRGRGWARARRNQIENAHDSAYSVCSAVSIVRRSQACATPR